MFAGYSLVFRNLLSVITRLFLFDRFYCLVCLTVFVMSFCSFSSFNFESHGNKKYGSPFDAPRDMRSSQGKMEKSFLRFAFCNYFLS